MGEPPSNDFKVAIFVPKSRAENVPEIISPFEPLRPNTIHQFFNRPDWYDEPREIQFGFQFSW